MRILGRAFFTYLIPVLLFGCVSVNKIEVSDSEFEEQLGRGSLRLTCNFSCSGSWGFYGVNMKALHDLESWLDLSKRVYSIGFDGDQGYYYLGRAAEGFGFHDAALTYYRLAKSSINSCDYLFDNCDGLVFPEDIDRRVQNLSPGLNYSNNNQIEIAPTEIDKPAIGEPLAQVESPAENVTSSRQDNTIEASRSAALRNLDKTWPAEQWPLTVESGELSCYDGNQLLFASAGTTYNINGVRTGNKYADVMTIWKAPEKFMYNGQMLEGPRILMVLLDEVSELCAARGQMYVGVNSQDEQYFYCGYTNLDGSAQDYSKWGKGTDFEYNEANSRWEWISEYTFQYIHPDGRYEQKARVAFFDDQLGHCNSEMERIYNQKVNETLQKNR